VYNSAAVHNVHVYFELTVYLLGDIEILKGWFPILLMPQVEDQGKSQLIFKCCDSSASEFHHRKFPIRTMH